MNGFVEICRGLLGDVRRDPWFAAAAVASFMLTMWAAWSSIGFVSCDEHFQIFEFIGYKRGFVQASELAWEFRAKSRSWIQPYFYHILTWPYFNWISKDAYHTAYLCRVITGLLSWASLIWALRVFLSPLTQGRRLAIWSAALVYFQPTLGVHPMSEVLSGICIASAVACAQRLCRDLGEQRQGLYFYLTVAFAILATAFRLQVGLMAAGLAAFLALERQFNRRRLAGALSIVVLVAATIVGTDYWGLGEWTFTPWTYFRVQVLQGKAAEFGVSPFWYYPKLVVDTFFPFGFILLVGTVCFWFRHRRHVLTLSTVPFVIVQSAIGHKELRFLLPMALPAVLMTVLQLSQWDWSPIWRRGFLALLALANGMALAQFLKARELSLLAMREIYDLAGAPATLVWNQEDPLKFCGNLTPAFYAV